MARKDSSPISNKWTALNVHGGWKVSRAVASKGDEKSELQVQMRRVGCIATAQMLVAGQGRRKSLCFSWSLKVGTDSSFPVQAVFQGVRAACLTPFSDPHVNFHRTHLHRQTQVVWPRVWAPRGSHWHMKRTVPENIPTKRQESSLYSKCISLLC